MSNPQPWWAKGLLFENCDCASVCPAHISFYQPCNHERCIGYWAFDIKEGRWGEHSLDGMKVFLLGDSPQVMADGGWIQEIYIDDSADEVQRHALESIFTGQAGSGWAVMASFVGERLPTRYAPIQMAHEGRNMTVNIEGVVDSTVVSAKGVDPERWVTLHNLRNQIHGHEHGLGLGTTLASGERISFQYDKSNAIFSKFSWKGP